MEDPEHSEGLTGSLAVVNWKKADCVKGVNMKEEIKQSLLKQIVFCEYNNPVFIGHYIGEKIRLAEQVINTYEPDIAADILDDLLEVRCLPEFPVARNINDFRRSVRQLVRGLWTGNFDLFTFVDDMSTAIRRNLTIAWNEGAEQCGINPDELSVEEINAREDFINSQISYLPEFGQAIVENSKENKGRLGPFLTRSEMWINRYNEARTMGAAMACADEKREWQLGATEKHCKSCNGFNGRVYRFSTWLDNNALPQSSSLCCNGFNCDCSLNPTEKRVTPGKFPASLLC